MSVRPEEVLKAVALASSPVSSLIGTRWYPNAAPQNSLYPLVCCDIESDEPRGHLTGCNWAIAKLDVRVYASSYESAQNVAEKLRFALNHYKANTTVSAETVLPTIILESQSDTPAGVVDGSDKPIYGITQKYVVSMAQASS
jgi:hypothetical protein